MLACAKDDPVYRILVQFQQACRGSNSDPFRCVMDNLVDCLSWQMDTEQSTAVCGCKTFAAGSTVE